MRSCCFVHPVAESVGDSAGHAVILDGRMGGFPAECVQAGNGREIPLVVTRLQRTDNVNSRLSTPRFRLSLTTGILLL